MGFCTYLPWSQRRSRRRRRRERAVRLVHAFGASESEKTSGTRVVLTGNAAKAALADHCSIIVVKHVRSRYPGMRAVPKIQLFTLAFYV